MEEKKNETFSVKREDVRTACNQNEHFAGEYVCFGWWTEKTFAITIMLRTVAKVGYI